MKIKFFTVGNDFVREYGSAPSKGDEVYFYGSLYRVSRVVWMPPHSVEQVQISLNQENRFTGDVR